MLPARRFKRDPIPSALFFPLPVRSALSSTFTARLALPPSFRRRRGAPLPSIVQRSMSPSSSTSDGAIASAPAARELAGNSVERSRYLPLPSLRNTNSAGALLSAVDFAPSRRLSQPYWS